MLLGSGNSAVADVKEDVLEHEHGSCVFAVGDCAKIVDRFIKHPEEFRETR